MENQGIIDEIKFYFCDANTATFGTFRWDGHGDDKSNAPRMRLVRVARIIRMLRFFSELRVMVNGVMSQRYSWKSLHLPKGQISDIWSEFARKYPIFEHSPWNGFKVATWSPLNKNITQRHYGLSQAIALGLCLPSDFDVHGALNQTRRNRAWDIK